MHRAIPKAALATVVAVLLVACSTTPPSLSAPASSSPITAPAEPTATVLASPAVSPTPILRADGMATVAAPGGLSVWSAPGPKKAKVLEPDLESGAVVYLIEGPRHAHGFDWWEIQSELAPRVGGPFGWVHASEAGKRPTLVPFAPDCPLPGVPVESAVTKSLGTLRALACFGGREVMLRGQLTCYSATIDSAVGGASWLGTDASCSMDDTFWLEGSVVTGVLHGTPSNPVVGRYEVRGHFDDPEAAGCSWIPFGTNMLSPSGHPDPGAVITCRQAFVVTAVTKLP